MNDLKYMKTTYSVINEPDIKDLAGIKRILEECHDYDNGRGFLSNWGIIRSCFDDGDLSVMKDYRGKYIGFICYDTSQIIFSGAVDIPIMFIVSEYRYRGAGSYLWYEFERYIKMEYENVDIFTLFCEPKASRFFWSKVGFEKYIKVKGRGDYAHLAMFKPTIKVKKDVKNYREMDNKIEIWDVDQHVAKDDIEPVKVYYIAEIEGKLKEPIIIVSNSFDITARWTKNGKVIRDTRLKYFPKKDIQIFSDMIKINSLTEK